MNARAELVHDCRDCRVIRVFPDGVKTRFNGGQYGSLGLPSSSDAAKLVKRAYSVSSPLVGEDGGLLDANDLPYYEFFFNRVDAPEDGRERLTPKLFQLKDGDRIFCGSKFSGHYVADKAPRGKSVLLVSTTTGEAANNSVLGGLLAAGRSEAIRFVVAGPDGWESPYRAAHERLARRFPNYSRVDLAAAGYSKLEALISGMKLDPARWHVFLCGDPAMIGAPEKLGGWSYQERQGGLMKLLAAAGFEAGTRFKEGSIDYESYW